MKALKTFAVNSEMSVVSSNS